MQAFLNLIDGKKSYIVGGLAVIIGGLFLFGVVTPDQLQAYAKMIADAIGSGFVLAGLGFIALRSALNKLL